MRGTSWRACTRRGLAPRIAAVCSLAVGPASASAATARSELLRGTRADPIPTAASRLRPASPDPARAPSRGIFVLAFDGVELSTGDIDDAHADVTQIAELSGIFEPYGVGPKRDAVMQAVRATLAEYDLVVTQTRPASGEYALSVVSPTNPLAGTADAASVLGIAVLDCGDAQTQRNVTFAFHGIDDAYSAAATATTITQELAHAIGLEHVDDPRDVMYPHNVEADTEFLDECVPVVPDAKGRIYCGEQHAIECGAPDLQNAHAELLARFGHAKPDTTPPVVRITSPADAAVVALATDVEIEVAVDDDDALVTARLFVDGDPVDGDEVAPFGWTLRDPAPGTHELYVEAYDLAGNVGVSDPVTVEVSSTPRDALPDVYGLTGPTGGCACDASDPGGGRGAVSLIMVLVACVPRRRLAA